MNRKSNIAIGLGVAALVATTGALSAAEQQVSAEASGEQMTAVEYRSENADRSDSVRLEAHVRGSASAEVGSESNGNGERPAPPDKPDVPDKPETPEVPNETVDGLIDEVRTERDTLVAETRRTVGDLHEMSQEERREAIAEIRGERDEVRQDVRNIGDAVSEERRAVMDERREAIDELRRERAELQEVRREMLEELRRERDELLDTQREVRAEARVEVH